MAKQMKNFFAVLLSVLMLFSVVATMNVFAAEDIPSSGQIGDNVYYKLDEEGTVTITGDGPMWDYDDENNKSPFYMNESIKNIIIEDGVSAIGNYLFCDCRWIANILIPDSVITIGNYTFYDCVSLETIEIPNAVISIGSNAFFKCLSLKNVNIPSRVTTIESGTFYKCHSLESIEIPNSVTSVGSEAFYDCSNLQSVIIGDSVITVGEHAFDACTNLSKIIIPDKMSIIDDGAFADCYFLEEIYVESRDVKIDNTDIGMGFTYSSKYTKALKEEFRDLVDSFGKIDNSLEIRLYRFEIDENEYEELLSAAFFNLTKGKGALLSFIAKIDLVNTKANPFAVVHCYKESKAAEYAIDNGIAVSFFEDKLNHEHSYTKNVTRESTCIESGIITYICECGETYTETIPALVHKALACPEVSPTCTENGSTGGTLCEYCGMIFTQPEVIPKLGHHYKETVIKTSCETDGVSIFKCKNCDDSFTVEYLAKGHIDKDNDGKCDSCETDLDAQKPTEPSNPNKSQNTSFFGKIINFLKNIINRIKNLFKIK